LYGNGHTSFIIVFGSAFHEFDGIAAMIASIGPLTNGRVNGDEGDEGDDDPAESGSGTGSDAVVVEEGSVWGDIEAGIVDGALVTVTPLLPTALAVSDNALLREGEPLTPLVLTELPELLEPLPHAVIRQPVAAVCKMSIAR
jgi:hypothetical protein